MSRVINLTIHNLTPSQLNDGAIEPTTYAKEEIKKLLLVEGIPSATNLEDRVNSLISLIQSEVENYDFVPECVLVGSGPPALNYLLTKRLVEEGIIPFFSHSNRICVEEALPDGTVSKKYIFAHEGFYTI